MSASRGLTLLNSFCAAILGAAAALSTQPLGAQEQHATYQAPPVARKGKVSAARQVNYAAPEPAPQMMPAAEAANARPLEPQNRERLFSGNHSMPAAAEPAAFRAPPRKLAARRTKSPSSRSPRLAQRELLPTPAAPRGSMTEAEIFGDGAEIVPEGAVVDGGPMEGDVVYEGAADEFYPDAMSGDCANGCESECCCDECCFVGPWFWENFSVFAGVQAFKSSPDQGTNGNFGFHEGINWAIPVVDGCGLGFQAGAQGVHSDFSGTTTIDDSRGQFFGTMGLFYRPECMRGLQGGAVVDHLSDDLQEDRDITQLRAELSLLGHCGHEFGAWIATGGSEDGNATPGAQATVWESTDMFAFFYRHRFCNGSTLRGWGGFTDEDEGLIGGDASLPVTTRLSVATAFNYRVPNEDTRIADAREEAWGLSVNLVWNVGYKDCNARTNRFRPLFDVADNTTLMLKQR